MGIDRLAVNVIRLVVSVAVITAAARAQAQFCTNGHAPDVVRVKLSLDCGNPEKIEVRRNGDDRNCLGGERQDAGWWSIDPFTETIGSVMLCSKVCGYASVCARGRPREEKDAQGNNVCVAEYTFKCDESGWTLGVQAKPPATLSYTRTRDARPQQRGEMKVSSLRSTEVCDLAPDETVSIVPHTKKSYTFEPIPISHDALEERKGSWILGSDSLMEFVRFPDGTRTRPVTANERAYVQLDIKELTLMIAPPNLPGAPR